jgi:acyl transferase domain-containing protein
LAVPAEVIPWPLDRLKRISVNSFGLGGANAHVIVDAAPSTSEPNGIHASGPNGTHVSGPNATHASGSNGILPAKSTRSEGAEQRLLVFSAHSEVSLQKMISNYNEFIERESFRLSDLAYTLSVRRHHWNVRSFCVSDGKKLQAVPAVKTPKFKGLLFIFTGQGAQWPGMGRELLRDFSTFGGDIRKMDLWLAESSHPPSWKIEGTPAPCHLCIAQHGTYANSSTQSSYEILAISILRNLLSQSLQQSRLHWLTCYDNGMFSQPP